MRLGPPLLCGNKGGGRDAAPVSPRRSWDEGRGVSRTHLGVGADELPPALAAVERKVEAPELVLLVRRRPGCRRGCAVKRRRAVADPPAAVLVGHVERSVVVRRRRRAQGERPLRGRRRMRPRGRRLGEGRLLRRRRRRRVVDVPAHHPALVAADDPLVAAPPLRPRLVALPLTRDPALGAHVPKVQVGVVLAPVKAAKDPDALARRELDHLVPAPALAQPRPPRPARGALARAQEGVKQAGLGHGVHRLLGRGPRRRDGADEVVVQGREERVLERGRRGRCEERGEDRVARASQVGEDRPHRARFIGLPETERGVERQRERQLLLTAAQKAWVGSAPA